MYLVRIYILETKKLDEVIYGHIFYYTPKHYLMFIEYRPLSITLLHEHYKYFFPCKYNFHGYWQVKN